MHVVHISPAQLGLVCTYCIEPTVREASSWPYQAAASTEQEYVSVTERCDTVCWEDFAAPNRGLLYTSSSDVSPDPSLGVLLQVLPQAPLLSPQRLPLIDALIIAIIQIKSFNSSLADFSCALFHYIFCLCCNRLLNKSTP